MAYIFGIHPALEALRGTPDKIERITFARGQLKGALADVAKIARDLNIRTEFLPRERLSTLSDGGVHQGVVLKIAEFAYVEIEDVIEKVERARTDGLVLILDGIEDPHNFGALLRSAYAMGAQAVVIQKDRAVGVTGTVVKASAGAVSHLTIARVTNLARALDQLKAANIWISAADLNGDRLPHQVDFKSPSGIVIGSEGEGVRRLILEKSDFRVRIPMAGKLGSLNASNAGAILMYEVARQRAGK